MRLALQAAYTFWINTLAAALIAAGAVAPIAAILYGLSTLPVSAARTFALAFTCVGLGIGIHVIARRAREFARMSFELALLWIVFVAGLVAGTGLFLTWLDDRAARRKAR